MDTKVPLTVRDAAGQLRDLIEDVSQFLDHQKSLGISHVTADSSAQRTLSAWGTPEWQQHRFRCQGPEDAKIMLIDSLGTFYSGKAGRLLVKILGAMHLTPETVLICNTAEREKIRARVRVQAPRVIITLGQEAADLLLDSNGSLDTLRGRFQSFEGAKVMPTFHPGQLIEDAKLKRPVWEDMQQVMTSAGLDHGG